MDIEVFSDGILRFQGKEYKCALGRGGVGIKRGEGDNVTPVGTYNLEQAFYRPDKLDRPASGLDFRATKENQGWCVDPNDSENYNKPVTLPHPDNHERMWRNDDIYDIVVVFGYNTRPVQLGLGSAYFIHVARANYSPTEGCVALSKPDLLEILKQIKPATKIVISNKTAK